MKTTMLNLLIIAGVTLAVQSCKDKNNCHAGKGGNLTIVAFPQHHVVMPIISRSNYPDTVFVKFNTQDQPGTNLSDYETFYVGEVGENHVHLNGLKCGDYFFYAVGYDTTLSVKV